MTVLLVAIPASRTATRNPLGPLLIVGIAVLAPLATLMIRQVRSARWSNVDASKPAERPILFAVALAGLVAAVGWLLITDPHSFLVRGMCVIAAFLIVAALLTRWIKLSLHVAFAALTATALSMLGSAVGYALVPVVAALWWSRGELSRHSVRELAVGLLLGVVTGILLIV